MLAGAKWYGAVNCFRHSDSVDPSADQPWTFKKPESHLICQPTSTIVLRIPISGTPH